MNPVETFLSLLAPDVAVELREFFYHHPPDAPVLLACAIAAGVKDEYLRAGIEALDDEEDQ
jgi:hypothetical protein